MSTHLTSASPLPDLTTWATIAPTGTIKIVLDNLATAGSPIRAYPTIGIHRHRAIAYRSFDRSKG